MLEGRYLLAPNPKGLGAYFLCGICRGGGSTFFWGGGEYGSGRFSGSGAVVHILIFLIWPNDENDGNGFELSCRSHGTHRNPWNLNRFEFWRCLVMLSNYI